MICGCWRHPRHVRPQERSFGRQPQPRRPHSDHVLRTIRIQVSYGFLVSKIKIQHEVIKEVVGPREKIVAGIGKAEVSHFSSRKGGSSWPGRAKARYGSSVSEIRLIYVDAAGKDFWKSIQWFMTCPTSCHMVVPLHYLPPTQHPLQPGTWNAWRRSKGKGGVSYPVPVATPFACPSELTQTISLHSRISEELDRLI